MKPETAPGSVFQTLTQRKTLCRPAPSPRNGKSGRDKTWGLRITVYSPPEVDRIWLWVYYNKIPLYPIFYLLKGDCRILGMDGVSICQGGRGA